VFEAAVTIMLFMARTPPLVVGHKMWYKQIMEV
jgi:hypothetical protein